MIRLIIFCILSSPALFFFNDFKTFLVQVNPLTDWETLTHFAKIYLFPAIFLALFVFYPKKQKLLVNSLLLIFLCLISLFFLNITNKAIVSFITNDDTLYFSLLAYTVSLFFFFHACLYSLLINREKYINLALTFILYSWWFIYITELMFRFEINGFIASGSLVLANAILLFFIILIIRALTLRKGSPLPVQSNS